MRGNYRARKESLHSWISLCPIVATRDNGRIHNIVHLQARLHTCTLDDTLFKYLVMNGRAFAREHLTYAPLHDRMLHISYIRRQRRSLSPLTAGCASFNLGEFAGRSREHWPTSLRALGTLASASPAALCKCVSTCVGGPHSLSLSLSPFYGRFVTYMLIRLRVSVFHIACTGTTYVCRCDRLRGLLAGRTIPPPRENCIHPRETASNPETIPPESFRGFRRPLIGHFDADECIVIIARAVELTFHRADYDYFEFGALLWILLSRIVAKKSI